MAPLPGDAGPKVAIFLAVLAVLLAGLVSTIVINSRNLKPLLLEHAGYMRKFNAAWWCEKCGWVAINPSEYY
ncbi:hypothetical protein ACFWBG_33600 [Nocardia salmonicida]|uniref:hypothetical protein n=1 Tax=Nocardia salmonicida TaxID=53431 RepID=UPI003671D88B